MSRLETVQFPSSNEVFYGEKVALTQNGQLQANPFVRFSENEYGQRHFDAPLVAALADVADNLRVCGNDPVYPNFSIHPAFDVGSPSVENTINFMVAWGRATEMPLPRAEKIPEYFGGVRRAVANRRRNNLERTTLDAFGTLGYVYFTESGQPAVRFLFRAPTGRGYVRTAHTVTDGPASQLGADLLVDFQANQPLRFHRYVKYLGGGNNAIGAYRYDDDESQLLLKYS